MKHHSNRQNNQRQGAKSKKSPPTSGQIAEIILGSYEEIRNYVDSPYVDAMELLAAIKELGVDRPGLDLERLMVAMGPECLNLIIVKISGSKKYYLPSAKLFRKDLGKPPLIEQVETCLSEFDD